MKNGIKIAMEYLQETLGVQVTVSPIAKSYQGMLPIYMTEIYRLYQTSLFNTQIILAELKDDSELSIRQTEKQVQQMGDLLNKPVVVVLANVQAYNRKRLIEKGVSFIVPGKQLYMPELLMVLRESFTPLKTKHKADTLLPSAQFLLLYHLLSGEQKWRMEEHSFKDIAGKLHYTPMAITNAIDNLKFHGLIEVHGEKEKFIHFAYERQELWNITLKQNLLVNPIIKTVFTDEKPKDVFLLQSNVSALPEYTDLNPGGQAYYAMDKNDFYDLQKKKALVHSNDYEGQYALEVWKYNPLILANVLVNERAVVDPLSLYLSLMDNNNERIEIALEQILENYLWL